jgi:hypothetical protein
MATKEQNKRYFGYKKQQGFNYVSMFLKDDEKHLIRSVLKSSKREILLSFLNRVYAKAQDELARTTTANQGEENNEQAQATVAA